LLREHGGGELALLRIDSADQARQFAEAVAALAPYTGWRGRSSSWARGVAGNTSNCHALAARGLLRSYLLLCRGQCIACIEGNQIGRTYNMDSPMYPRGYARFPPGAVLLHLAVEDLINHRPAEFINFGYGNPCYGHSATNVRLRYGSFILFRRCLKFQVLSSLHASFQSAVALLRGGATRFSVIRAKA